MACQTIGQLAQLPSAECHLPFATFAAKTVAVPQTETQTEAPDMWERER